MRQYFLKLDTDNLPVPGQRVVLDGDESHHLSTVLRGGRDQVLHLTDGRGRRYTAQPVGPDQRSVQVEILSVTEDLAEIAPPQLVLACAVVKGKRFEWALEKAVEMGAHRIVPVVTRHGVIEPGSGRQQRWLNVLKAALKQSGRSWLPQLDEPLSLADFLARGSMGPTFFGAVPGEMKGTIPWARLLEQRPPMVPAALTLLVGPEGGWSAEELRAMTDSGAIAIELGPHVLRTETAAVSGLFALQALRGAWSQADPA